MLELLQNADDCDFADGVLPSLTVTFEQLVGKSSSLLGSRLGEVESQCFSGFG